MGYLLPQTWYNVSSTNAILSVMRERGVSFLLASISGFIDTAGFIALSGLFTAHVTGNLVLAGASISDRHDAELVSRLLMIPVFMLGIAVTYSLSRQFQRSGRDPFPWLLFGEGLLLALFAIAGFLCQDQHLFVRPHDVLWVGSLGVLSMSIQNAYMKVHLSRFVPTTVMTGNMTQFSTDLVDWLRLRNAANEADRTLKSELHLRMARFGTALLGFLIGAASGAFLVLHVGLMCCMVPALLLGGLGIRARHRGLGSMSAK